jgi:hypothetical protein
LTKVMERRKSSNGRLSGYIGYLSLDYVLF